MVAFNLTQKTETKMRYRNLPCCIYGQTAHTQHIWKLCNKENYKIMEVTLEYKICDHVYTNLKCYGICCNWEGEIGYQL